MPGKVKINDSVWQRIKKSLKRAEKAHVQVGVLQSKGGGAAHDSGITMVELAAVHEYGAPSVGVPERSFIRRTFKDKEQQLAEVIKKLAGQVVTEKLTLEKALNILGAWGASEVKKTITQGEHIPPPLSPVTIARKGSDRPLVDTGRLVNAIQWEVKIP